MDRRVVKGVCGLGKGNSGIHAAGGVHASVGENVGFDGVGLYSSKEYKRMRSCISLVLLVSDVINHNVVRVLFYEGTS